MMRTIFLILAVALLVPTIRPDSAAAQSDNRKDEPWIFVVHDGDKTSSLWPNKRKPEDEKWYTRMGNRQYWEAGPDGAKDFYGWIAKHQRAWDTVDGCYGKPLEAGTMALAEMTFDLAYDWMLGRNFTDDVLYPRPRGPRVEDALIGFDEVSGMANYITCGKKKGFMGVSKTGPLSANRIWVGSAANALVKRMPTFHLSAAHELGHLVQNNIAPTKQADKARYRKASNARWIIEGAADAIGIMHAQDYHSGKEYFGPYSNKYYRRFFLSRAYNIPLNYPHKEQTDSNVGAPGKAQENLLDSIENKTLKNIDYQTNGFWYHVIERYLEGDPKGLHGLYEKMEGPEVARNATVIVDKWLDGVDGAMDGLEHVLPQFLAEYASWSEHRFAGEMSQDKWLSLGFGGCQTVAVGAGGHSRTIRLELAEYAGTCIKVSIPPEITYLQPDMQIRVTGQEDAVREFYLGWASGNVFLDSSSAMDCFDHVERQGREIGIAPCLLTPMDGLLNNAYQRYFYLPGIVQAGPPVLVPTDSNIATEFLLVASWVPQEAQDSRRDFDFADLELTISLDWSDLASGGPASQGSPATTDYASKKGRGPVAAEGEEAPEKATMRDVFTGNVATLPDMPPEAAQIVGELSEGSISIAVDSEDGDGPRVTLFFREELEFGQTGPIDVVAASEDDVRLGIQNPEIKSRLTIEEYTDAALRFSGEAHVCEGEMTPAQLAATTDGSDLCDAFPPRRYQVSGTIAFPTALNSEARLQQPPMSEAYRKYQNLRLSRLEQRFGWSGQITGEDADGGPIQPGPNDDQNTGSLREQRDADCNCDCDSPDRDSGNLQCQLLCGKMWQQCVQD